jgi:hypothetical protein
MTEDNLERKFTDKQTKKIIVGYTVYSEKVREIIEEELSRKITERSKAKALATIQRKSELVFEMTQNELNKIIPESYKFGLEWADNSAIKAINEMPTADFKTKLEVNREIQARKIATGNKAASSAELQFAIENNIVMQKKITESIIKNTIYGDLHNEAMQNLLTSSYEDFRKGLAGIQTSASNILAKAQAQQIRTTIAETQLKKTSIEKIKKEVLKKLTDQGFTTIVDKNGRNMPIKWYAEMLSRTEAIRTANEAAVNRAAELGVNIVMFSEHLSSCDICIPYEGLLFDLTGEKYPYPPEPPLHPNCRHILILRPDLTL